MEDNQKIFIALFSLIFIFSFFYFSQKTTENLKRSILAQISDAFQKEKNINEGLPFEEKFSQIEEKLDKIYLQLEEILNSTENLKINEEKEEKKEIQKVSETLCQNFNSAPKREVIFNEICWMGDENSPNNEWIELKNISSKEINLEGWQLLNKSQRIKIVFEEKTILPSQLLVLNRGDDFSGAIKNSDEILYLFDENCNLQDIVEATSSWPAGDNKTKRTMERKNDLTWQTSVFPGGTPGKENSEGLVVIEEKEEKNEEKNKPEISLKYPSPLYSQKEFEVFFSVSNLEYYDNYDLKISILKSSDESEQKRTISEISLKGEEWQDSYRYLTNVFTGRNFSGYFKMRIPEDFSGEGEILVKIRQTLNKKIVAEWKEKVFIERKIESSTNFSPSIPLFSPTTSNEQQSTQNEQPTTSLPSVKKILINEVQIAGQNANDEFIELYNPNDEEIDLTGWKLTRKTASGSEYTILSDRTSVKFEGKIPAKGFFLIAHPSSTFATMADLVHSGNQSLAKDNTLLLYMPSGEISDKVGWGEVVDYEGTPFPQNPLENQSLERINFQDTDCNRCDFQLQNSPTPKNSKQ